MAFLKPVRLLPAKTAYPFVKFYKIFTGLSVASLIATAVLIATVGLNFGIDFRGGTLIEIKTLDGPADVAALRSKIGALGLGDTQLQTFGAPDDVLIRIAEQPGGDKAQTEAIAKVRAALGERVEIRRTETVGSVVSQELIQSAILALVLACIGIGIYVWLRFEWQFSLGAIAALVHDLTITIGIFSLLNLNFDLTIVAALLTILGFSINDTVVIFDRIRENMRKYKKMPIEELIDLSINETLSRTLMTAGTAFVALLALYILGGEVIRGFVFAMLIGTIVGTYSSVYIAAPVLILIGVNRESFSGSGNRETPPGAKRKPAPAATEPAESGSPETVSPGRGSRASAAAAAPVSGLALAEPVAESARAGVTAAPAAPKPVKAAGASKAGAQTKTGAKRGRGGVKR
jgi:preprotein translocase SecF subunit